MGVEYKSGIMIVWHDAAGHQLIYACTPYISPWARSESFPFCAFLSLQGSLGSSGMGMGMSGLSYLGGWL